MCRASGKPPALRAPGGLFASGLREQTEQTCLMAFGWGSLLCAPTLQSLGLGGGFWGESIHFGGESVGENAPLGGENAPLGGESAHLLGENAHLEVKVPICWVNVPIWR